MFFEPTLYIPYIGAAFVLLIVPGPTIMTVTAYGLSQGPRSAWASTAGVALGDTFAIAVSLTGLSALLALSTQLFTIIKWLGAAYLVWLGIQTWFESTHTDVKDVKTPAPSGQRVTLIRIFRQTFIVTALNPKGIAFFVAFIPPFISLQHSYWPQIWLYGLSFVLLAALNAFAYAYFAGRLSAFFTKPRLLKWIKRVGAGFLMGAGLYTATTRFSS